MPTKKQKTAAKDPRSLERRANLEVGDRFKLSVTGSQRCPRLAAKLGTVAGLIPYSKTITVRFDGNKTTTAIHRDYIEPAG